MYSTDEGEHAYPASTPACIGFRVSGKGGSVFFGSGIYPNLAHGVRWDVLELIWGVFNT